MVVVCWQLPRQFVTQTNLLFWQFQFVCLLGRNQQQSTDGVIVRRIIFNQIFWSSIKSFSIYILCRKYWYLTWIGMHPLQLKHHLSFGEQSWIMFSNNRKNTKLTCNIYYIKYKTLNIKYWIFLLPGNRHRTASWILLQ